MLNELNKLLKMTVEEVISSTHSLTLLKIYSKLHLNGAEPRTCEASIRKYYFELKKNYEMNKQILQRTCKPSFEGRVYVPGIFDKDGKLIAGHLHIHSEYITDEIANDYLKKGILNENQFLVLPDGYVSEVKEVKKVEVEAENKVKGYTKDELIEVVEREDFNEVSKVGKELGLFEKRGKKDEMIKALNNYISELN